MTGHIDPTKDIFAAFRDNDPGPIHMLNTVRLHAEALIRTAARRPAPTPMPPMAVERPGVSRLGGKIVWRGARGADRPAGGRGITASSPNIRRWRRSSR